MPNPFDQFDPASGNPFDQFDPAVHTSAAATTTPPPATGSGVLPNYGAGFEEGVTGGLDLLDKAINPVRRVSDLINIAGKFGGAKSNVVPVVDQPFYNHLLGKIGINPDDVIESSAAERIARFAGQGTSAVLIPGEGEAGLLAAGGRALTGAVSGLGAGVASEAAPDRFKPAAALFGSLAAGIPFSMATTAASQIPGAVDRATALARAGTSDAAAERVAGQVLAKNATDLPTVKAMLARPAAPIIPGSDPTTFQATGDMGLGSLERSAATKNPELFRARQADQNAARLIKLQNISVDNYGSSAPAPANPAAVGDFFRSQLHQIDTDTAANVTNNLDNARTQASALGGTTGPEVHGQLIRDAVSEAESSARQQEGALWKAVDPNGDLVGNVALTARRAKDISGSMRPTEKPMAGEEAAVFDQAKELPRVAPVADLIALRSRTSAAMRDELVTNGRTPSYARLAQLRGAIQDNLSNTISDRADSDVAAIKSGDLAPDQSIIGRIQAWRNQWEASRADQAATASGVGSAESAGGLPGPAGTTGLPGDAPTFDAAAADRLKQATEATKARAQTFGLGAVGQILRTAGSKNLYRLSEGAVPAKFFHPGPTGFQDAQNLSNAIGSEKAMPLLTEAAASSLRKAAMGDDGTIDPTKFATWQAQHSDALRALPPDVRTSFSNAAAASKAVAEATQVRTAALKEIQAGAMGRLLGANAPEDVTRIIGQTFSSPQSTAMMKALSDGVKSDPDASAGLRQAVADHIAQRYVSNTEVGTSGLSAIKADAFQTFLKTQRGALSQVFTPAQMDSLNAIGADLRQAARSQNAVRIPGQSNTAQDLAAVGKQTSILGQLWRDAVAGGGGFVLGGPFGAAIGSIGAHSFQALRELGIQRVDQLVTQAMLDPVFAGKLLARGPSLAVRGVDNTFARALRRSFMGAAATQVARRRP